MACADTTLSGNGFFSYSSELYNASTTHKRAGYAQGFRTTRRMEPLLADDRGNTTWTKGEFTKHSGEWNVNAQREINQDFRKDRRALLDYIKTCGKHMNLQEGSRIYSEILQLGLLQKDTGIAAALISMFSKCGSLRKAEEVFDQLHQRNAVSWTSLITGYVQHGFAEKALTCFEKMIEEGYRADAITYMCVLKACGTLGLIQKGEEIHSEIKKEGLLMEHVRLGNALVDMYLKCGDLTKAKKVFDQLPERNVISWTTIISGYIQNGFADDAIKCFASMKDEGHPPDTVTFASVLKACGMSGLAEKGEEIHSEVSKQGLETNLALGTALVDMYAKCGALAEAENVFYRLPVRDVVSWTTLISLYVQHGHGEECLDCFEQMKHEGIFPDSVTFALILKACGIIGSAKKGAEIHFELIMQGLLENNVMLGTALLDMYAKCGAFAEAEHVFQRLPVRDVVSWTALIGGYAQHGLGHEAMNCFEKMCEDGVSPDTATFACVLIACGSIGLADKGEEIHVKIRNQGMLEKDIIVGAGLVDMYAKCGALEKAQEVFDELPVRNVVTWTALIAGYVQHEFCNEAFDCFQKMKDDGIAASTFTYACVLKCCGSIGSLEKGEEIHDDLKNQGLFDNDAVLGTALVDMYVKCGVLEKAQKVFDNLTRRNVASWNALIGGYSQIGQADTVLTLFDRMIVEDVVPDDVTWVILLTTCSHAGLVEEGEIYFDIMGTVYFSTPTLQQYTCMVDLYSRAGFFDKAMTIIEKIPTSECLPLWSAVMGGCRKWSNVEIGLTAFQRSLQVDEKFAPAYVSMRNIYAAVGMFDEAEKVEALRKEKCSWNVSDRCWWTDPNKNIHSFSPADKNHPQRKYMYAKLENIGKRLLREGYLQNMHRFFQPIPDDSQDDELSGHSEKLGIAFALINTAEGMPIRITKNTSVCCDCHYAISLTSKIEKRVIQVKDVDWIHIFKNGKCTCEGL